MKRIWTIAGVIALILALTVTAAVLAQDTDPTPDPTLTPESEATPAAPAWGRYMDEDGDGVCDFAGMMGWGARYVDEDGDGVCDNCPEGYQLGQPYGPSVGMMGRGMRPGMMGRGMWSFGSTDDEDNTGAWTRPGSRSGRGMYGRSWGPRW